MNAADATEDRVATLHALLNDSAVKIGEQRLVIGERGTEISNLRAALTALLPEAINDRYLTQSYAVERAQTLLAKSNTGEAT